MAADPREHALRTLLVEAVRTIAPDLGTLERLIGRIAPAAWGELPRPVGYREAIELVVKHAIESRWNDALVEELERIAPRNDVVVDLRALLAPDAQPYRGDTVTGSGRPLDGWLTAGGRRDRYIDSPGGAALVGGAHHRRARFAGERALELGKAG